MLQTLNNLAGKISPTSGGMLPDRLPNSINNNNNSIASNNNNNTCVKNNNSEVSYSKQIDDSEEMKDQPDPDYIKMFVGQVPKSMDEKDLTNMFSVFGRIHQINVLRDKLSGQSKGCCFITFYTRKAALDAQNALHNIKILPGMNHPIQVKPADSENRNERKLFVGMISKKFTEADIRAMFEGFGTIEECMVLRDNAGQSKGCAFVTYTSKQCALNAIKAMHHSKTMEGCSLPLVVKFADTQKEKDQKRLQQMQANLWNLAGMSLTPHSYLNQQLLQQIQASNSSANLGTQLLLQNSSAAGGLHNLTAATMNGSSTGLTDISSANLQNLAALANLSAVNGMSPMNMQNLVALAAMTGAANTVSPNGNVGLVGNNVSDVRNDYVWLNEQKRRYIPRNTELPYYYQPSLSGLGSTAAGGPTLSALTNSLNGYASAGLSIPGAYQQYSATPKPAVSSTSAASSSLSGGSGKQIFGPEGANLFIYHLPNEFTDSDLIATFEPFGNVISAKVFIDRDTNISKCFGFVSFDNTLSAQNAIQSMNGFQIGHKRLKVQPKRPKEASRPY